MRMKNLVALGLALGISIVTVGCGGSQANKNGQDATSSASKKEEVVIESESTNEVKEQTEEITEAK